MSNDEANDESVPSALSVVLPLLIRVDSCPFVVGSSFRYSLRDLPDEVPKNLSEKLVHRLRRFTQIFWGRSLESNCHSV